MANDRARVYQTNLKEVRKLGSATDLGGTRLSLNLHPLIWGLTPSPFARSCMTMGGRETQKTTNLLPNVFMTPALPNVHVRKPSVTRTARQYTTQSPKSCVCPGAGPQKQHMASRSKNGAKSRQPVSRAANGNCSSQANHTSSLLQASVPRNGSCRLRNGQWAAKQNSRFLSGSLKKID